MTFAYYRVNLAAERNAAMIAFCWLLKTSKDSKYSFQV